MIRVVIADDHAIFREGLAGLLRSVGDVELLGEASDGSALAELITRLEPDVAVADVSMPRHDLGRLAEDLRTRGARTRLIALTVHREPEVARPLLRAGVAGYVLKENAFDDLLDAVRAAASGGTYVSPLLAAALFAPA
jgi:DNA-binding NarL/FixJ family response regulator